MSRSGESLVTDITQVEYTVVDLMGLIFYDLSWINGNPFSGEAMLLKTSNPDAATVECAAGGSWCDQAYMNPSMNAATHAAPIGSDLDFFLC